MQYAVLPMRIIDSSCDHIFHSVLGDDDAGKTTRNEKDAANLINTLLIVCLT